MSVRVYFIIGPTASGKSCLAMNLAKRVGGEIINADSIQVYKSLDIGSAKPSSEDLRDVRHHLIGHVPEGEKYTAGRFREEVLETLARRVGEGCKDFFIVGGSGFYLKALINGLYEIPDISEKVRVQVRSESLESLYQELKKVDPEAASKIKPQDSYRISRAIEVYRETKTPFSQFKASHLKKTFPYSYKKIGLKGDRSVLEKRIRKRAQEMLVNGLLDEVRKLVNLGYRDWSALQSVGYKEVLKYFDGEIQERDLLDEIVKSTMSLVKRQMTWFKKEADIHWFSFETSSDEIKEFLKI